MNLFANQTEQSEIKIANARNSNAKVSLLTNRLESQAVGVANCFKNQTHFLSWYVIPFPDHKQNEFVSQQAYLHDKHSGSHMSLAILLS